MCGFFYNPRYDFLGVGIYYRVPTQVLQSLIKSYIVFFIYKALQSLIFGYFRPQRSNKVLFLIENNLPLESGVSILEAMLI